MVSTVTQQELKKLKEAATRAASDIDEKRLNSVQELTEITRDYQKTMIEAIEKAQKNIDKKVEFAGENVSGKVNSLLLFIVIIIQIAILGSL